MHPITVEKQKAVIRMCRRFRVRRLELFGSAARNEFDDATSDLDFAVQFEKFGPAEYADAFFGLLEELQALFGCEIDLVVLSAVKNPYFLESIERSMIPLYAA